jgi:hypothetical protein
MYGIILVSSTSHAMRCEHVLHQAGIACKLVPVPRNLSANCGLAVCFDWDQRTQVITTLQANRVDYDQIVPFS